MADPELVEILKQGPDAWNKWRQENLGKRVGPRKTVNINRLVSGP